VTVGASLVPVIVKVTVLGATRQGNFVALRSGAVVLKAR
jgi:hypothetical protein